MKGQFFRLLYSLLFTKKCSKCGRLLLTAESRKIGLGPECRKGTGWEQKVLEKNGQIRMEGL